MRTLFFVLIAFIAFILVIVIALISIYRSIVADEIKSLQTWDCGGTKMELLELKEFFGGGHSYRQIFRFNNKKFSSGFFPKEPFRQKDLVIHYYPIKPKQELWNIYIDPSLFTLEEFNQLVACWEKNQGEFNQISTSPSFDKPLAIGRIIYGNEPPRLTFKNPNPPRFSPSSRFADTTVASEEIDISITGSWGLYLRFNKPSQTFDQEGEYVVDGNVLVENNEYILSVSVVSMGRDIPPKIDEEFIKYLSKFKDEKGKTPLDYYDRIRYNDSINNKVIELTSTKAKGRENTKTIN